MPYRYPDMELVHQYDFENKTLKAAPNDPSTNIHHFGCRFTCILAIVQYATRRILTKEQIIDVYNLSLKKGVMEKNCYVKDDNAIIDICLAYMGDTTHKIRQVYVVGERDTQMTMRHNHKIFTEETLPGKGIGYFIIVDMLTRSSPQYGGHHFVLYNAAGELVYDPYRNHIGKYVGFARLLYYSIRGGDQ
jgi:hypothetical protein